MKIDKPEAVRLALGFLSFCTVLGTTRHQIDTSEICRAISAAGFAYLSPSKFGVTNNGNNQPNR